MSLIKHLAAALEAYDQEADNRHAAIVMLLTELKQQGALIMSTVEEKVAELNGVLDNIGTSVTGVMNDVNELMNQIGLLKDQLNQGQLSAEQAAALDAVISRASTVKDNLATIDAMNPATPPAPTT